MRRPWRQRFATNAFPAQWGVALRDGAQPMLGYVARGYYALQLEMLDKCFGAIDVLVLDSANLFADTAATCNRVFDFMGLEDFDVEPGQGFQPRFLSRENRSAGGSIGCASTIGRMTRCSRSFSGNLLAGCGRASILWLLRRSV